MGGTLALRELLGRDQAMRLAMTAAEISGAEALAIGLVTALDDDPLAAGQALAEQLLQRSPDAIAAVKRLYRKSWNNGSGRALARESAYQLRILAGANQGIAVARQAGKSRDYRPAKKW
ncbi:MAG: enoyl-CoA hydratase-related protein [Xanthomonadales bacterium]|nr:enoyl-CoA hydratase-related protein [Xanthomonadales bacterium]